MLRRAGRRPAAPRRWAPPRRRPGARAAPTAAAVASHGSAKPAPAAQPPLPGAAESGSGTAGPSEAEAEDAAAAEADAAAAAELGRELRDARGLQGKAAAAAAVRATLKLLELRRPPVPEMALALDTLAAVAPEPGPRVTEAAEAVAEVLKRLSRGPMRRHAVYACVAATAVARLRVSSPEVGRVLAVAATAAMRRGQLPLDAAAAAVSALRPPGACTAGARYALLACGTATVLPKGWMVPEEQHHFPVICSGPLACQLLLSFAGLRAERSAWFLGDILVTNGRRMLAGVAREAVRHGSKPETEGQLVCKVVWATVTLRMARAACRLSEPYAARVAAMAAAGEFPLAAGLAASSLSAARRCRGCPQCAAGARTISLLRVPPAAPHSAAARRFDMGPEPRGAPRRSRCRCRREQTPSKTGWGEPGSSSTSHMGRAPRAAQHQGQEWPHRHHAACRRACIRAHLPHPSCLRARARRMQ
eukprot:TRINITY_DN7341_c0_g1_i8.p1 TRINITY_DN7341_c0_g1~~TRINITY_DN7341_c0_g1_i8.p1  ORF type:complete len:489 (+),score=84.38 TRINITY_DN7341_c0_g1_i8:40-1467(+)